VNSVLNNLLNSWQTKGDKTGSIAARYSQIHSCTTDYVGMRIGAKWSALGPGDLTSSSEECPTAAFNEIRSCGMRGAGYRGPPTKPFANNVAHTCVAYEIAVQ